MPKTYTTVQGDMWDLIAYQQMGNEMYMGALIDANKKYREIVVFPAGVPLTIPDVATPTSVNLPPWKRG
jgi:phage tail protein X